MCSQTTKKEIMEGFDDLLELCQGTRNIASLISSRKLKKGGVVILSMQAFLKNGVGKLF